MKLPMYIEQKNEASKLLFYNEVKNLEFTEMIENMNIKHLINLKERDKKLTDIGKKLFKKHPLIKPKLIFKKKGTLILSQEEINNLLTSSDERIRKKVKIFEWSLIIHFRNRSYKIKFPFWKAKSNKVEERSHEYKKEFLSEEEIELLLNGLKEGG